MAGICGIWLKGREGDDRDLSAVLDRMLNKLGATDDQLRASLQGAGCAAGNIVAVNATRNQRFVHNPMLSLYCLADGLVFIADEERRLAEKHFGFSPLSSAYEYIPYLYQLYKDRFLQRISGNFTLFLFDTQTHTAILANDRSGLLPLFVYETDQFLLFASRLESILASGWMEQVRFDEVSLAEQALFHYPVSGHSLVRSVVTIRAASLWKLSGHVEKQTYWTPAELLGQRPLSWNEGLDSIDNAFRKVILKPFQDHDQPVGLTLTGGWDGRLVLAYAMQAGMDRLKLFSFGAASSPDIRIPGLIARSEGLDYTPYQLDEAYMQSVFAGVAGRTIRFSNGLRSYKRAHYLYALEQQSAMTGRFLSGNFGDEMIKFAQIQPSEVISRHMIRYAEASFPRLDMHSLRQMFPYLMEEVFTLDHREEFIERMNQFASEVSGYQSISMKYHHARHRIIAPGFFGNEMNSYNDYADNFSPFLDQDLIQAFTGSLCSGAYHPFNSNKMQHKEMAARLYAILIRRNRSSLLHYTTDRGYPVADVLSPFGRLSILVKTRLKKKNQSADPYHLKEAGQHFGAVYGDSTSSALPGSLQQLIAPAPNSADKKESMLYWLKYISGRYTVQTS